MNPHRAIEMVALLLMVAAGGTQAASPTCAAALRSAFGGAPPVAPVPHSELPTGVMAEDPHTLTLARTSANSRWLYGQIEKDAIYTCITYKKCIYVTI